MASILAVVVLFPGVSLAGVFDISGSGLSNIDSSGGTSTSITVTGYSGLFVGDLNLRVTESGPWAEDIDIYLTHGGVTVLIFDAQYDYFGYMDAVFDDEASSAVPHAVGNIVGTFRPDNPLSAFDALPLDGTWTISFDDTIVPGDGDDLTAWSIYGFATPEPGTLSIFGLGLAGFAAYAVRRRRRSASTR